MLGQPANAVAGTVPFWLEPATTQVSPGEIFTVDIKVDASGQPTDTAEAWVKFDPGYLRVVDNAGNETGVIEDGELKIDGTWPQVLANAVDNTGGFVHYAAGRTGTEGSAANRLFTLATIRFKVVASIPDGGTVLSFLTEALRETVAMSGLDDVTGTLTGATVYGVPVPVLSRLELSGTIPAMNIEDTFNLTGLTLRGYDQNGDPYSLEGKTVVWESVYTNVATVSNATLTAVGPGRGAVRASVEGVTSNALYFDVVDSQAPAWPAGSQLTATDVTASSVTLSWPAATDNVGVTAYRIYRDGSLITTLGSDARSYLATGLSPATSYTFEVRAGDAAGNWSSGLSTQVTTPEVTVPPIIIQLTGDRITHEQSVVLSAYLQDESPAEWTWELRNSVGQKVSGATATGPELYAELFLPEAYWDLPVDADWTVVVTAYQADKGSRQEQRTVHVYNYPLSVTDLQTTDQTGNPTNAFSRGTMAVFRATVAREVSGDPMAALLILQVRDSQDRVVYLGFVEDSVAYGQPRHLGNGFLLPLNMPTGTYRLEAYVLNHWPAQEGWMALAGKREVSFTVN